MFNEWARRWRALSLATVSVALGLVSAAALAEGGLRLFQLAPSDRVFTVTDAELHTVPGLLAPNQAVVDRRLRQLPHHVRINNFGYRGPDFPRDKHAGEFRFFMVGDSFTYGDFVDDRDTLPAQLEDRLRERCVGVRVINAGLGGTTIDTQMKLIERALSLQPDMFALVFSENDVSDLANVSMWDQLASNRRLKSSMPFG